MASGRVGDWRGNQLAEPVGGEFLFTWLDESEATPDELEALAGTDEEAWIVEQEEVMLYR